MHNCRRTVTAIVLAFTSLFCTQLYAADDDREAAGWHKWADFTGKLVTAGKADPFEFGAIVPACDGVTGVVTGQGFQFPYWAQNIMMACRVFDIFKDVAQKTSAGIDDYRDKDSIGGMMKTILKRERKILCRNSATASKELAKAEAIAAEPRAQPLALELKAQMDRVAVLTGC
jgi:hypothetical protein